MPHGDHGFDAARNGGYTIAFVNQFQLDEARDLALVFDNENVQVSTSLIGQCRRWHDERYTPNG